MQRRTYEKHYPNDRIGNLTLIERMPGGQKWKCVCDCGEMVLTQIANGSRSCSKCARKKAALKNIKHNESSRKSKGSTRLYRIWTGMNNRCNNPRNHGFCNYGGRGITVCEEWKTYLAFKQWALSHEYNETLSIDRINNDGNYCPDNCKWASLSDQMKNTRRTHVVTIDNKAMCVVDWCRLLGMIKSNAYCNAKKQGITIEEYLSYRWNRFKTRHETNSNEKKVE